MTDTPRDTCPACNGSGKIDWGAYGVEDCGQCHGDGFVRQPHDPDEL